jgi:lipopolysaccharide biosynthesis glycosyltransferase
MTKVTFYSDYIQIDFASNDYFVPYMSAMMQSVMENAGLKKKYAFFVMHQDISEFSMQKLSAQIAQYQQFSIDFVNVTQYFKEYTFYIENKKSISEETFFRLIIPELFSEYEKVIYLDGDMICCTDIAELYHFELGNNLLAAPCDILGQYFYYKNKKYKKMIHEDGIRVVKNTDNYFIAGVLVINIPLFRVSFSTKEILDFAVSRKWKIHDQDVLNVLCEGKVLMLPLSWSFMKLANDASKYIPEHLFDVYSKSEKELKIFHYNWVYRKPWANTFHVPYFEYFWKYATRTPFINVITSRMTEDNLIRTETLGEIVFNNIKYRQGIGIRFILKCFWARFLHDLGLSKKDTVN